MREKELKQLIVEEFLGALQDPRVERTRKHSLETILVLSLLAVISGADSFVEIERYGKAKQDWLSSFLDLSGGVPSHDTIGRVFAMLDPSALGQAFQRWTMAMAACSQDKLIAIDGKVLRRSFRKAGDHAFVHMVSAWSADNGVVLGQVKSNDETNGKSNEVTAIVALLDLINVEGALVSIDAAGTQTAIADKIIDKSGDYLLAVKGNQPTRHAALLDYFDDIGDRWADFCETDEHAHGRHELRRAWVRHDVQDIVDAGGRWPKLRSVIHVQSVRTVAEQSSTEDRYYVSSRRLSATQALHAVRSHWGIENSLHWVLDVAFGEDDCRVRAGNAAENFAATRRLALSLLKQRTEAKCGIKARRHMAGWDHSFLLRVIGLSAAD